MMRVRKIKSDALILRVSIMCYRMPLHGSSGEQLSYVIYINAVYTILTTIMLLARRYVK